MNRAIRCLLLALLMLVSLRSLSAQVAISVSFGPPALPVYEQPLCPAEGYIWTPGYWAWDPDYGDYYWVPGTWVLAPEVGYLWTPPWWGWEGGAFLFHTGIGARISDSMAASITVSATSVTALREVAGKAIISSTTALS